MIAPKVLPMPPKTTIVRASEEQTEKDLQVRYNFFSEVIITYRRYFCHSILA
jgi:hypothetical protein